MSSYVSDSRVLPQRLKMSVFVFSYEFEIPIRFTIILGISAQQVLPALVVSTNDTLLLRLA